MTMTYQQQYVLEGLAGRAAILNLDARHNRLYSDGGNGQRLVTVDHEITVDGVDATQRCVALLFDMTELRAIGMYSDRLIYERGGWYFTSRQLEWDPVPRTTGVSR